MLDDTSPKKVDMSPEAVDRRLCEVSMLWRLGMELRSARSLGPLDTVTAVPTTDNTYNLDGSCRKAIEVISDFPPGHSEVQTRKQ